MSVRRAISHFVDKSIKYFSKMSSKKVTGALRICPFPFCMVMQFENICPKNKLKFVKNAEDINYSTNVKS